MTTKKIQEVGFCPKCGGGMLTYGDFDICRCDYSYTCDGCGFSGLEQYHLDFVEHLNANGTTISDDEDDDDD